MPLSEDCARLTVTSGWVVECFKPSYYEMLSVFGDNVDAIVDGITQQLMPFCNVTPTTGAEIELRRRMTNAVATLLRNPEAARGDLPLWLAALLEG